MMDSLWHNIAYDKAYASSTSHSFLLMAQVLQQAGYIPVATKMDGIDTTIKV